VCDEVHTLDQPLLVQVEVPDAIELLVNKPGFEIRIFPGKDSVLMESRA